MNDDFHAVKLAAMNHALSAYGLDKLANAPPGFFSRLFRYRTPKPNESSLRGFAGAVGDMARDMVVGSPLSLKDQLLKHHAETGSWGKAIGQHFKEFYIPRSTGSTGGDTLNRAFSLGFPAYDLYGAVTTDNPETRRQRIAGALAGLAVAPVTGYMGMPGGLVSGAVSNLASRAVAKNPATALQGPVGHYAPYRPQT